MNLMDLVEPLRTRLHSHPKLLRLPADRPVVYVGDTHGDLGATECVFDRFPVPQHVLVFLGDAVDRGPDSAGNLARILSEHFDHPGSVHLLMGNHEAWCIADFYPAEFWSQLEPEDARRLGETLALLPLVAWHPAGVLASHGALPDVASLKAIDQIGLGSEAWRDITWGDWSETGKTSSPRFGARPLYDREDFEQRMNRLDAAVLVRSHQPSVPRYLFADRCLTLFTTHGYGNGSRCVGILRPGVRPATARDLEVVDV